MLTADEKNVLISSIVTNCKCSYGDKAILNQLSDDTLMAVTLNAMPPEMMKGKEKPKAAPVQVTVTTDDDEPEEEEEVVENERQVPQLTEKQFMQMMPPSMREDMALGRRTKIARRNELISQLVANVAEDEKQEKADLLVNESIDRLEFLVGLIPTNNVNSEHVQLVNYRGLPGTYVQNTRRQAVKPDDTLNLPTVNWNEAFGAKQTG
jgi:hypothetical protein